MRTVSRTAQFKRDVRRLQRQGKDLDQLKTVLQSLVSGAAPEAKFRDHVLVGQYKGSRECHIEPDWLLIYESSADEILLIRTGSHSDLFK